MLLYNYGGDSVHIYTRHLLQDKESTHLLKLDFSFRNLLSESTTRQSLIEGWSFLDSCYFAVISLAKVGFGDYVPHTQPPESFAT